jgi:hypothetical protein
VVATPPPTARFDWIRTFEEILSDGPYRPSEEMFEVTKSRAAAVPVETSKLYAGFTAPMPTESGK